MMARKAEAEQSAGYVQARRGLMRGTFGLSSSQGGRSRVDVVLGNGMAAPPWTTLGLQKILEYSDDGDQAM